MDDILQDASNPESLAELKRVVDALYARASFAEFCKQAWHTIEQDTKFLWNWHHQLVCDVMQGMFEDWEKAKDDPDFVQRTTSALFSLPPGSAKPVDENGLVHELERGLIPLKEIRVGHQVLTHKGRFREVTAVHLQGELPLIEFTTLRGRKIRVAPNHPMLTQRGWVEAQHVTLRDVFAEVHATEPSGLDEITQEEARLAGYLIGDGCMQKTGASFTNQDKDTIADFANCANTIGLDVTTRQRPPSLIKSSTHATIIVHLKSLRTDICCDCEDQPVVIGSRRCSGCHNRRNNQLRRGFEPDDNTPIRDVQTWLIKLNLLGKNSRTKRVPQQIMSGTEDLIAEYLAAYWACDGGIEDRRDIPRVGRVNQTTQSVRIKASTVSEGLARDHQALLQRLGLSFSLRRKSSRLTAAMCGASGKRIGEEYISWDLCAADQDTAAKFMIVIGRRMHHEKSTRAKGLQRNRFDQVLHADPVIAITAQAPANCRCLTVEEDSSFVYQGVAVHNSKILSVLFMCWVWTRRPGVKFICLSVNEDATLRDARAARDVLKSDWYQRSFSPEWSIKNDQDAISNFANTAGGERLSRAQGSEIVGLRGDCLDGSTMVATEFGSQSIQELHDLELFGIPLPRVWSFNHQTGKQELKKIITTRHLINKDVVDVRAGSDTITCTPDHRFWNGSAYIAAKDMLWGSVLNLQSTAVGVSKVSPVLATKVDVYDIQVEGNHNFFANGVLVHNCLIVDDPNNPKESESKKVRDEVNNLWDSNIFSRVNDVLRSLKFGVQQRTHAMDWTGHVLSQQGTWHPTKNPRGWLHVVLPAEYESSRRCVTPWGSDPRNAEGESIHPERWPLSWLKLERERLRDQYAGQMQQRPTLAEGGMVLNKWWNFFRLAKGVRPDVDDELLSTRPRPGGCSEAPALLLPAATHRVGWDLDKIVLSVDPANKRTDKGSRWACVMAGIKGGRRYILDVKAERGDYLQILEGIIIPMCRYWSPNEILIEGKAAGPVLLTAIQRMLWDGTLRDEQGRQLVVSLTEVSADAKGTKEDRLQAVLSYIKNGQVLLRHGAEWLPDFIEEFNLFPNGSTDDICDSLSQLLAESMVSGVSLPDW